MSRGPTLRPALHRAWRAWCARPITRGDAILWAIGWLLASLIHRVVVIAWSYAHG